MTPRWPVPSLLPHGGAMVLIGEPAAYGDGWAEAAVRIGEDSLFYKAGHGVPSWVGVEYMAQTTALYLGIGAVRLDRNSVTDVVTARSTLFEDTRRRTGLIRKVSDALAKVGAPRAALPRPGDLYVEDTNAETHFDLLSEVLRGCRS